MTKKRENSVWGGTPPKSRWNPSMFLFKCKNCDHEYLKEISPFTVKDVILKSSENYKKFFAQRFQCPKCRNYTPPIILILDTNLNVMNWGELLPANSIDYEKWKQKIEKEPLLILDDYRALLPDSKPNKEIIDLFKKHNYNIEIKYIEHKPKVLKSTKKILNKKPK